MAHIKVINEILSVVYFLLCWKRFMFDMHPISLDSDQ